MHDESRLESVRLAILACEEIDMPERAPDLYQAFISALLKKAHSGNGSRPPTVALSEAVGLYQQSKLAAGLKDKSIRNYMDWLHRFEKFVSANELDWTKPENAEAWLVNLRTTPSPHVARPGPDSPPGYLSTTSINTAFCRLRGFYNWLQQRGLLLENPIALMTEPPASARDPKAIPHDLALQIISTASARLRYWADFRDLAMVLVVYCTGLRAGEVAALTLDDLSLEERTLTVVAGKGDKDRIVVFSASVERALRAWLQVRPTHKGSDRLFLGRKGPMINSGIYAIFKRLSHRAELPKVYGPHSYRHALARWYLQNGGNIKHLSEQLGHASVETTARIYAVYMLSERKADHERATPLAAMRDDLNTIIPLQSTFSP